MKRPWSQRFGHRQQPKDKPQGANHALISGSIATALGSLVSIALFAGFVAASAHFVSLGDFAALNAYYGIALLSTDLSDFGTSINYLVRFPKMSETAAKREMDMLLTARAAGHTFALAVWVVVPALFHVRGGYPAMAAAALFAGGFSLRNTLQTGARAEQRYDLSAWYQILERLLALVLLLTFQPSTATGCLLCLVVGSFGVVVPLVVRRRTKARLAGARMIYLQALPYGIGSTVSDLNNLEIPLVSAISGARAGGYFAAPSRLLSPLALVGNSIAAVLAREGAGIDDDHDLRRSVRLSIAWSMALVGLTGAVVAILSPTLVPRVLGAKFRPAVVPTQIACVTAFFASGATQYGSALQSRRQGKAVGTYVVIQMSLYLICVGIGAQLHAATGAAAGAAIATAIGFAVGATFWSRYLQNASSDLGPTETALG